MAFVTLTAARLSLLSDPTVEVVLPHLAGLERTRRKASTLVQFEGDDLPTSFRGTSGGRTFALTCWYAADEHPAYLALLDLLAQARDAVDDRLLLRTYVGQVAGLDGAHIIVVPEDTQSPGDGGLTWQVAFTATSVNGTVAV